MSGRLEARSHVAMVVDLSVVSDPDAGVFVREWLLPSSKIDDAETDMRQDRGVSAHRPTPSGPRWVITSRMRTARVHLQSSGLIATIPTMPHISEASGLRPRIILVASGPSCR